MNLRRNLKKRNQLFVTLLCFLLLTGYSGTVVASDIPGLRGTVQDGVNGLLVPPREPEALADAICRALEDAALLDRLSRAARPSVERFAWEPRIREFEELVQRLAAGASRE